MTIAGGRGALAALIERASYDVPRGFLDSEEQEEPLAGQDHRDTIDPLCAPLRARLAGQECYVAAELRLFRNPEVRRDYREPDLLVAPGVEDYSRSGYPLWLLLPPALVIEKLSESSVENRDLTAKRDWYRREGVREYRLVDPNGDYAPQARLQGRRFHDRASSDGDERLAMDGGGTLIPFGRRLLADASIGGQMPLVDRETGDVSPPIWEIEPLRFVTFANLRAAAAQDEAGRLLAEARATAETRGRIAAEERADREAARNQALEEKIARLRRGQGPPGDESLG